MDSDVTDGLFAAHAVRGIVGSRKCTRDGRFEWTGRLDKGPGRRTPSSPQPSRAVQPRHSNRPVRVERLDAVGAGGPDRGRHGGVTMKRTRHVLLGCAVALFAAPLALASLAADEPYAGDVAPPPITGSESQGTAPAPAPPTLTTVGGTVESSRPGSLVVTTDTGSRMTFHTDGSSGVPTSLATGDRVTVVYQSQEGGTYHASSVTLDASGSSAATPPRDEAQPMGRPLPQTASYGPLLGLLGALSLGAAAGLKVASASRR